jgi:threonine/homoserine/homoserine lactone efflux protein
VITPGSATAVVVRNVLERGRRGGYLTAAGVAAGNSSWAVGAALGLSALAARAPVVLDAVRVGGAAYLAFLGLRSISSALVGRALPDSPREPDRVRATRRRPQSFEQGLITSLLNPSIPLYYLAIVPSFLPTPAFLQPRFVLYAAIHVGFAFVCHAAWVTGFYAVRAFWEGPRARRVMHAAIGAALLALAAALSLEPRALRLVP